MCGANLWLLLFVMPWRDETTPWRGMYDYIYVPWTTDGASNIGLAFVNFESPASCQEYLLVLSNPDNMMKITRYQVKSIGPAAIQGRGAGRVPIGDEFAAAQFATLKALRGFDAPLAFSQGVPQNLETVADMEVPGQLQARFF
eukprot:Skav230710  [mRNA]  locus=scaffold715:61654:73065:+ [translate_table: standard]